MNNNKYFALFLSVLCASACSDDQFVDDVKTDKEEINFAYVLDSESGHTRAYSASEYHTGAEAMTDLKTVLVCVRNAKADAPATLIAKKWYPASGDANVIYWDDVSNNQYDVRNDAKVNIWAAKLAGREAGSSTGQVSVSDAGVLTWDITTDQTGGIDGNDLLAADYQSAYTASTSAVPLCFHHAMTKVTVNIKKAENSGFTDAEITTNPAVTLIKPNTKAAVDLTKKQPGTADDTNFVSGSQESTPANVTMHKMGTAATGYLVSFDAIVAPGEEITLNKELATITITDANGKSNVYDVKASQDILDNWSGNTSASSVTLQYGVNYVINASISKKEITFTAQVVGWNEKTATGETRIVFDADVVSYTGTTGSDITTNGANFSLWMATDNSADTNYDGDAAADGINPRATVTCSNANNVVTWSSSPLLYWPDNSTQYYFRALATYNGTTYTKQEDQKAAQGTDLLWGTTSKHAALDANGNPVLENGQAKTYQEGEAIKPRTGNVPMVFKHAMSKISIELKSPDGIDDAAKVDFTDATLKIINHYDGGTISINDGSIVTLTSTSNPLSGTVTAETNSGNTVYKWQNQIVIPQSLVQKYNDQNQLEDRTVTPIHYSITELTKIYSDGTSNSNGGGEGTYYLTTDLELVGAVYYTDATAKEHNGTIEGHVKAGDVQTPAVETVYYTYSEFETALKWRDIDEGEYNAYSFPKEAKVKYGENNTLVLYEIEELKAVKLYENMTEEKFNSLTDDLKKYRQAEIDAANAIVNATSYTQGTDLYSENLAIKTAGTDYSYVDFKNRLEYRYISQADFDNLDPIKKAKTYTHQEYIALGSITSDMFAALPDEYKVKTPGSDAVLYTQETADAHNATLSGAVHAGDIQTAAYYKLPENTTLTSHNPGDVKTQGDKIMLYITLQDGTTASLALSTCTTIVNYEEGNVTKAVDAWEPGQHYVYTIYMSKEKITFRAMIKDWVAVETSGNATLDWD